MSNAILDALIIAESVVIAAFAVLLIAGNLWARFDKWRNPVYPQCDIDPRNHPAYRDGWIGNVKAAR